MRMTLLPHSQLTHQIHAQHRKRISASRSFEAIWTGWQFRGTASLFRVAPSPDASTHFTAAFTLGFHKGQLPSYRSSSM